MHLFPVAARQPLLTHSPARTAYSCHSKLKQSTSEVQGWDWRGAVNFNSGGEGLYLCSQGISSKRVGDTSALSSRLE